MAKSPVRPGSSDLPVGGCRDPRTPETFRCPGATFPQLTSGSCLAVGVIVSSLPRRSLDARDGTLHQPAAFAFAVGVGVPGHLQRPDGEALLPRRAVALDESDDGDGFTPDQRQAAPLGVGQLGW